MYLFLGNRYSALEVHLGHLDDEFHLGIAALLLHFDSISLLDSWIGADVEVLL